MSLFEGLPVEGNVNRAPYVSGKAPLDMDLIDTMVEEWIRDWTGSTFTVKMNVITAPHRDETKLHVRRLKDKIGDGFDPNLFLECLIHRFFIDDSSFRVSNERLGYELDCVVQALYSLGYNNLKVSLPEPEYPYDEYTLGSYIRGSWRRPLEVTYRAPKINNAGFGVHRCKLSFEGTVEWGGGAGSNRSELRFLGSVKSAKGWQTSCSVYLNSASSLGLPTSLPDAKGCTYHISGGLTEAELESIKTGWPLYAMPFMKTNKLLVPDGKGKWKEVTP